MRTFTIVLGLAISAVLVLPSAPGAAQEEEGGEEKSLETLPIIEKSIDYHGFRVWQSAQISGLLQSASGTFALRSRRKGPGFDYFVIVEEGATVTEYRVNNDMVGKSINGEAVELATDEERQEVEDFVSDRIYTTLLPFLLGEPGVQARDLGVESWQDRELLRVGVTYEEGAGPHCGEEFVFWFDPETGRLEQFAYSFDGGLRFRQLFHHARNHGVVLFNQKNFGAEGEKLKLEQITAEFVAEKMVELKPILLDPVRVRLLR